MHARTGKKRSEMGDSAWLRAEKQYLPNRDPDTTQFSIGHCVIPFALMLWPAAWVPLASQTLHGF